MMNSIDDPSLTLIKPGPVHVTVLPGTISRISLAVSWTTTAASSDFHHATACYATHGLAIKILSVCLSFKCVHCDKTK